MGNLDAALNNALIARRPGIAAITPLANYVGFFSAGRNAPLLHLEAIFLLSDARSSVSVITRGQRRRQILKLQS